MADIKTFKYKLIKNFLLKQELEILQKYCSTKLNYLWSDDSQSPLAPCWYKDPLMDSFLELKIDKMEKETGLKLFKTYAYWRYYIFGSRLENHKDRPSCEISATVCIHKTDNWPIHMNNNWIELEEGDAVIYLGCELTHGRKPFKGDGCAQVFFHYVDKNGPYTEYVNDKRS
jgi:hypothetical protein